MNAPDRLATRVELEALVRRVAHWFGGSELEQEQMLREALRNPEEARARFKAQLETIFGPDSINARIRRHVQYKPPTAAEDLAARRERARLDRQEQERRAA